MSKLKSRSLVLASGSPRRIKLLKKWGIKFRNEIPSISENRIIHSKYAISGCIENAQLKAKAVWSNNPGNIILAADTIVMFQDKILGKPKNPIDAQEMLKLFSGKHHQVITGVCFILPNNTCITDHETTHVHFRKLSIEDILGYISTRESYDKAGAYGIQERGALLIKSIEGCYFNVVGLPVRPVFDVLKTIGFPIWN